MLCRIVGFIGMLVLALLTVPLPAETQQVGKVTAAARQGLLEGVRYRINIPANWNGGLVVFAHEYEGEGSGMGSLRYNPLDGYLTKHGYASETSGYRSRGYRPDWFVDDCAPGNVHMG
ncbi:hypothetical protein [Candidatus Entotheonella palauensis]|uniref:Uncharacterized protein n=1 Tax=Entotheonella factor TaxID=1429438 RepID=W4L7R8_ENTF1|nr:hypothetical protein [Candidatus Entotheonella palauensis]ETW93949.1 MAG: hypothetical protein ETSY1_36975 [Candidatus Entotheonella factor]